MATKNEITNNSKPMAYDALLGSVFTPNGADKWVLIAKDIKGRLFVESETGYIAYYDIESFSRSFRLVN
jgi:hypothetical protein